MRKREANRSKIEIHDQLAGREGMLTRPDRWKRPHLERGPAGTPAGAWCGEKVLAEGHPILLKWIAPRNQEWLGCVVNRRAACQPASSSMNAGLHCGRVLYNTGEERSLVMGAGCGLRGSVGGNADIGCSVMEPGRLGAG